MTLIDISQPLKRGVPVWPGDTEFSFDLAWRKEESGSVNVGRITMSTHTGTHIDAPFHFEDDGSKVIELDPAVYVNPDEPDAPVGEEGSRIRTQVGNVVRKPVALAPRSRPDQEPGDASGDLSFQIFGTDTLYSEQVYQPCVADVDGRVEFDHLTAVVLEMEGGVDVRAGVGAHCDPADVHRSALFFPPREVERELRVAGPDRDASLQRLGDVDQGHCCNHLRGTSCL